jgi:hypothetical protein
MKITRAARHFCCARSVARPGNVAVNRTAADAGLAILNEGGDVADGLIA